MSCFFVGPRGQETLTTQALLKMGISGLWEASGGARGLNKKEIYISCVDLLGFLGGRNDLFSFCGFWFGSRGLRKRFAIPSNVLNVGHCIE